MKIKINNILSKEELLTSIEEGTSMPKSQSLLLAYMLYYGDSNCPKKHVYSFLNELDEFYPLKLFTDYLEDDLNTIHNEIIDYTSSDDSDLADLFNQIVMLVYYHFMYIDKKEWKRCFKENIGNKKEKLSLLQNLVNDVCDLLDAHHLEFVENKEEILNTQESIDNILVDFNLKKIYIDNIGIENVYEENKALRIAFSVISKYMLYLCSEDECLLEMLELTEERINSYKDNKDNYNDDYEYIYNSLYCYFNIYRGKIRG